MLALGVIFLAAIFVSLSSKMLGPSIIFTLAALGYRNDETALWTIVGGLLITMLIANFRER